MATPYASERRDEWPGFGAKSTNEATIRRPMLAIGRGRWRWSELRRGAEIAEKDCAASLPGSEARSVYAAAGGGLSGATDR
jgi:hypothetical protein